MAKKAILRTDLAHQPFKPGEDEDKANELIVLGKAVEYSYEESKLIDPQTLFATAVTIGGFTTIDESNEGIYDGSITLTGITTDGYAKCELRRRGTVNDTKVLKDSDTELIFEDLTAGTYSVYILNQDEVTLAEELNIEIFVV